MSALDFGSVMLLPLVSIAASLGTVLVLLLVHRAKSKSKVGTEVHSSSGWPESHASFALRPERWLAIKRRKPAKVQAALGLHNARSCTWLEGLMGETAFFIAPALKGWIVVVGSGLPDPAVDVDECYRFLVGLSRKVGQVQFFSANRAVHHHSWAWTKRGRVVRAYAWTGQTVWTQGVQTSAERELGLVCYDYGESPEHSLFQQGRLAAANVDKVPLLAARWGLDPGDLAELCLGQAQGIAGERS
jgi:hypothetical protein